MADTHVPDQIPSNRPSENPEGERPPVGETPAVPPREVRELVSKERVAEKSKRTQWREEFPYHWRDDDLVTRRDTLRFLVAGTGALFLATTALAAIGNAPPNGPTSYHKAIARVNELRDNFVRVFDFPNQYSQGILIKLPGAAKPVCYSDVCTHLSCAVLYNPSDVKLHCPCHEGVFDAYTGDVLGGPPTRPLSLIEYEEVNGVIYATKVVER